MNQNSISRVVAILNGGGYRVEQGLAVCGIHGLGRITSASIFLWQYLVLEIEDGCRILVDCLLQGGECVISEEGEAPAHITFRALTVVRDGRTMVKGTRCPGAEVTMVRLEHIAKSDERRKIDEADVLDLYKGAMLDVAINDAQP